MSTQIYKPDSAINLDVRIYAEQSEAPMRLLRFYLAMTIMMFCLINQATTVWAAGTTGAEFLQIGLGAKQAALGQAFTSIEGGIDSLGWNNAGLTKVKNIEGTFMHYEGFEGIKYEYVGIATKLTSIGVLGFSANYLTAGKMIGRDIAGKLTEEFTANSMGINLAYAREIITNIDMGIGFRWIQEKIENEIATGFSADLGILAKLFSEELRIGMSIQNIGTKMKFINESYAQPLTMRLGIGYELVLNKYFEALIAIDGVIPERERVYLNFGSELCYSKLFAIRVGYSTDKNLEKGIGITIGGGIRWQEYELDYAYIPFGDLGATHRFSITARF